MLDIKTERTSKTSVRSVVTIPKGGLEWSLLLRSDVHHDNAHCLRDLELRHLKQAKERGAGIFDNGDLFCAMQGPYDPRQDKTQLRDEDKRNDYYDGILEEAADFYAPFSKNFLQLTPGNHEYQVAKRHGTDLTRRLADRLGCVRGTYQGWFVLTFKDATHCHSFRFRYTHGYGGGGPVTKDLIQLNRQLANIEGADFFLSGHTHDAWYAPVQREWVGNDLVPRTKEVACLKIAGYKDEWDDGDAFAALGGMSPKPKGGWWVHFKSYGGGNIKYTVERCDG